MRTIFFSCAAELCLAPERVSAQILDTSRWPEFQGYGPLPGIRSAEFETRTPEVVGSRIRVTSTDGSTHVEEIAEWEPARRVKLVMKEFSPPLSRLATSFEETWDFTPTDAGSKAVRSMTMNPTSGAARPLLWLISLLMRRALARHTRQIQIECEKVSTHS